MGNLSDNDRDLLTIAARRTVSYTFEPCQLGSRHVILASATDAEDLQAEFHRLALAGYLAERITGCGGMGEPPTTTVSYSLTAFGRHALGLHKKRTPPIHWHELPSEEEMARDAIE